MRYLFMFFTCYFFNLQSQNSSVDLNYYFSNQESTFDKSIPTPNSIIGHQVGEWHITHDKLVQYMKELAKFSDRVTIQNRGLTYEDRPLILLTITSKNNHSNIEEIKENHLALSNDTNVTNFNDLPLVIYQGFSIHGNEPSGSNASLLLAYYLAASKSNFIDDLLENTIILLDPSFNPDGLQRFAYWANTNKNYNSRPPARTIHNHMTEIPKPYRTISTRTWMKRCETISDAHSMRQLTILPCLHLHRFTTTEPATSVTNINNLQPACLRESW